MNNERLLELAGNPEFISGIYNYCNRWCERCRLTKRCLLFAQEQEERPAFTENDNDIDSALHELLFKSSGKSLEKDLRLTHPGGNRFAYYLRLP